MTKQIELTKQEIALLLRGVSAVLVEENAKGDRPLSGWKATKNFLLAESLEKRLTELANG